MIPRTALALATLAQPAIQVLAADAPQVQAHDNFQNVVRLPDGVLWRLASRFGAIYYSPSFDNGLTWQGGFTTPYKLFDTGGGLNPSPTVGLDGSLHLFQVRSDGASGLDLYHMQSNPARTTWGPATLIHNGRIGSMMKAITTSTGRLIAPFGDSTVPPPSGYGNNKTYVQYRDVGSTSFATSPDTLVSAVPSTWNGASDGACEPTVIEKNDGSLWMLMRSQTGKLTQSFSTNGGANWTAATNSNFYTTSGPPCLVRMDNGDMVLLWNNATMPPKYNNKIWYAGRDALHAAISQDDGVTWKGFREIYLDPFRNDNPPDGDTGTAYPFAAPTADGKIIAITGQAAAKTQLRIDPNWLLEKNRADDFTAPNALNNWSVFKPIGDVSSTKRQRVIGATLIDDPDPAKTKPVLQIRRPDTNDADGATWNFPAAARGTTSARVQLRPGFAGGEIALTDRFFNPTDLQGEANSFYRLSLPASGILPGGVQLQAGQWYDLSLDWKTDSRKAILRVDGAKVATFDAQSGIDVWPGLSYLRLRSTAAGVDTNGFLVDAVSHNAIGRRDAQRMNSADAEAALAGGNGWSTLKFDTFVPNNNTTTSGNGTTGTFASPYTGLVSASGAKIETSTGTVSFGDATSSQVTSDLIGTISGATTTIRFVFPKDGAFAATVSGVALRVGSVAADNVSVKAIDAAGVELPDWDFTTLSAATNGTVGWRGEEDLVTRSVIHAVQLSGAGADAWLIGSFAASPALNDLAVRDLKVAGSHRTSSSGSYHDPAAWDDLVPNSATAVACFTGSFNDGASVTVDAPATVNKMLFDSLSPHTLSGSSTIGFSGSGARLAVTLGQHQIDVPIVASNDLTLHVLANSTLSLQSSIAGGVLAKTGDGTLRAGKIQAHSLAVHAGTLQMHANGSGAGAAEVSSLSVDSLAKLDLTDNAMLIDFETADPRATLRSSIAAGRIFSSVGSEWGVGYAGASELGITTFLDIPVDASTLILRATLLGDATLDGRVNTADFNQLAGNFGAANAEWFHADFDYDNDVDSIDFNALMSNYGRAMPAPLGAVVPEPGTLGMTLALLALRRRRRHQA